MTTPTLTGRDEELGVLTGHIDQVAAGGGAIVVLGDPGIGKTSLLRAAADRGRAAGHRVLAVTGIQAEAHLPFAGLHHLLRPVLSDVDRLPATQREALSTAFGLSDGPPPQPFMIALATLNLLAEAAAGHPLALVELPLAIRAVASSGLETGPGLVPLTARLERAFAARVADLPALTRDALLIAAVDNADDLPEILAGASALAGQPVTVAALETAVTAGLLRFDDLHVQFRHPLVRSGVLQLETVTRRYAAHAALAEVLAGEPYRCTWHRAQSANGRDDEVADELEAAHVVALRRGSVTEAIWALERSAQLPVAADRRLAPVPHLPQAGDHRAGAAGRQAQPA